MTTTNANVVREFLARWFWLALIASMSAVGIVLVIAYVALLVLIVRDSAALGLALIAFTIVTFTGAVAAVQVNAARQAQCNTRHAESLTEQWDSFATWENVTDWKPAPLPSLYIDPIVYAKYTDDF